MLDELSECQPHIVIAGISTFGTINTDTYLDVITDNIGHFHEGHLRFHAALEKVFHIGGIEIHLALHKIVKCRVHRQQQLVNLGVGLHRLAALAVQTALTGIPQFGCAGQLASNCATVRSL